MFRETWLKLSYLHILVQGQRHFPEEKKEVRGRGRERERTKRLTYFQEKMVNFSIEEIRELMGKSTNVRNVRIPLKKTLSL
jgi:hypothetical protein